MSGATGGGTGSGSSLDRESVATISNLLRQYGLEELIPRVDRWVRDGLTWPEIEARLNDPSSDAGQVVDRLYPELREYRENPTNSGLPPINIATVQTYRQTLGRFVNERGYSAAFPTPDAVREAARRWIVAGKGMDEMARRFDILEQNAVVMAQTDPTLQAQLDAWERFYGQKPTTGDLVSMALNPSEAAPVIERRFASVRFDREAGLAGFGDLDREEAERLSDLGVDAARSGQTFGALAANRELFNPLDRGEDAITRQEQMDAGFTNSAAAKKRIEDRARRRTARFEGGGSLATSRDGAFGGLATSSDT